MTNLGFVKVHRKILDNPTICTDSDHFAVWNYLLLNATHKPYRANFKGKEIVLQPRRIDNGKKIDWRKI